MRDVFSAIAFIGFLAAAGLTLSNRVGHFSRRFRVNLFLLYTFGTSFAVGLTQRDLWPFVSWPLVAGTLPPVVTHQRLMAVDSLGSEHDVDYRAWYPLSFDELISWMNRGFLRLTPGEQDSVAIFLLRLAESNRQGAASGDHPGEWDRVLGPLTAPFFLMHPPIWNEPDQVPVHGFSGFRFYQESWNVEDRATANGEITRVLVYEYDRR